MADEILNIPEIAPGQPGASTVHNNAIKYLAQAANRKAVFASVGAGPLELSEDNLTRNMVIEVSGASSAFDVESPSTINSINTQRVFIVRNADTTYTATLKASTGTGATVEIEPETVVCVEQTGEDIYLLFTASTAAAPADPVDIGIFVPGEPADAAVVLQYRFARAVAFPVDFAGSYGYVGTNPTATADFDVLKNGTSIGTVSFGTGGAATFTLTGGASFVAGDRLTITAPSPKDTTLAQVAITLTGTR